MLFFQGPPGKKTFLHRLGKQAAGKKGGAVRAPQHAKRGKKGESKNFFLYWGGNKQGRCMFCPFIGGKAHFLAGLRQPRFKARLRAGEKGNGGAGEKKIVLNIYMGFCAPSIKGNKKKTHPKAKGDSSIFGGGTSGGRGRACRFSPGPPQKKRARRQGNVYHQNNPAGWGSEAHTQQTHHTGGPRRGNVIFFWAAPSSRV